MTDRPTHEAARHPKVLVVEDEAITRRALTALLIASGFPTQAVSSAEHEALEAMGGASPPAIALVDLDLPGMSGLELIHRLHELLPTVRPVLITATSRERLDDILNAGDVDYMRKPIDFKSLLHVLENQPHVH